MRNTPGKASAGGSSRSSEFNFRCGRLLKVHQTEFSRGVFTLRHVNLPSFMNILLLLRIDKDRYGVHVLCTLALSGYCLLVDIQQGSEDMRVFTLNLCLKQHNAGGGGHCLYWPDALPRRRLLPCSRRVLRFSIKSVLGENMELKADIAEENMGTALRDNSLWRNTCGLCHGDGRISQ